MLLGLKSNSSLFCRIMPSFRSKVLDALDIVKLSTKLNVRESFPSCTDLATGARFESSRPLDDGKHVLHNFALSETIQSKIIGPKNPIPGTILYSDHPHHTLDVLGFVVGEEPKESTTYKQSLPMCLKRDSTDVPLLKSTEGCFHYLNGLYDPQQLTLQDMRKSSLGTGIADGDSMVDDDDGIFVGRHTHKDWPSTILEQNELFRLNPYADSLYYGQMKLSMLLTGLTVPRQETGSNHRGLVRMLVLRPKLPSVKLRLTGAAGEPILNMTYPHHFDTDLFFSKKKTLGGRMKDGIHIRSAETGGVSEITPTYGLTKFRRPDKRTQLNKSSIHYGHYIPGDGIDHDLLPFDIITSPINSKAYTVIRDETFHLDTQHHGVAAQKLVNVTIPFNMKVKFAGRYPDPDVAPTAAVPAVGNVGDANYVAAVPASNGEAIYLSDVTNDEPQNINSRPFIMFLSMDQKISAQVTGYTNVYET
jgi:hypothetical protein